MNREDFINELVVTLLKDQLDTVESCIRMFGETDEDMEIKRALELIIDYNTVRKD